MFSLNDSMKYWLYNQPTDMRKSYYTLSGIVSNSMGLDPYNGDVYIFMNKSRNRIKLLHWEPGGLVIYSKLLEAGTFGNPSNIHMDELAGTIEWRDLVMIVEGIIEKRGSLHWSRMTNEKLQLPKIEKCCPVLYELLTGGDKDGITEMEFGASAEDADHGFGLEVALPGNLPLLLCLTPSLINKADSLRHKMLTVYNELVKNPPFPAWKSGIEDIWE